MQLRKKLKKVAADQGGFTLIELLVVIGILAILLAITLIALNPTQHFQGARNAQRSSDVTAILDGVYEYEAKNTGNLPPSVASLDTNAHALSNNTTKYNTSNSDPNPLRNQAPVNLCSDIVPTYLADLPKDPDTNFSSQTPSSGSACAATTYDTGYTIAKSVSGRFTISAPGAENGANIAVTR